MASLFTVGLGFAALAAAAPPASQDCDYSSTPSQVHFNYAGSNGMTVSWNTPAALEEPTVRYGVNGLFHSASSNVSLTYSTSTTYNNHVTITGLQPNTEYQYAVTCGAAGKTFKTAREAGDQTPFVFAFIADMGTMGPLGLSTDSAGAALNATEGNTMIALANAIDEYEFVWLDGDIAYADAWLKEEGANYLPNTTIDGGAAVYESILNAFFEEFTTVTAERPWMVGPGNHEADCDNGGTKDKATGVTYTESICLVGQTNFTGYRNHYRMPSAESGGVENFWYSWDYGMVHYIQYNSETDFPNAPDMPGGGQGINAGPFAPNGTQLAWLENDLANVDRSKTPWVIAAGHRPWYVGVDTDICLPCHEAFEPLFIKYDVDIALYGHVHLYERNMPIKNNVTDPKGLDNPTSTWYIINGAAGHYDGLDTFAGPKPAWEAVGIDTTYGWSRWTVHNSTHITQEFVDSASGKVLDSATLYKEHNTTQ